LSSDFYATREGDSPAKNGPFDKAIRPAKRLVLPCLGLIFVYNETQSLWGESLAQVACKLNMGLCPASVLVSMNTRNLPVTAWMVAIGAGTILIIGAFARFDPATSLKPGQVASSSPLAAKPGDPPAEATGTAVLPANLSPGLAEIIKLAQAHVDEGVMLAYVTNSGRVFSPSADEILYLKDIGLSQNVIGAIVKAAPPTATPLVAPAIVATPTPLPPPTEPPPSAAMQADATTSPFYNDLAPYGAWTQQPDYGLVWQPTVETADANWTPYVDAGQWLYSDSGWYWQSEYTWGWAAFHYGRWANIPRQGWAWVPGNQWGPAWVAWRYTDSCVGWAPLPPGVGLSAVAQLSFTGKPLGNATLGLPASAFSFVNVGNLTSRNLTHHLVSASRAKDLVRISTLLDSYSVVNNRVFNKGVSRDIVAAAAHKPVPEFSLRSVASQEAVGLAQDRKTLAVYVPPASPKGTSSTASPIKNQPHGQTQPVTISPEEPVMLAENKASEEEILAAESNIRGGSLELPSLHYPVPGNSPHQQPGHILAPGGNAASPNRDWAPDYTRPVVERPNAPAPTPRYDGYRPLAGQAEPPHNALENRPTPIETRPAPVEPARAAPAPAAPSSGGSKSGKS